MLYKTKARVLSKHACLLILKHERAGQQSKELSKQKPVRTQPPKYVHFPTITLNSSCTDKGGVVFYVLYYFRRPTSRDAMIRECAFAKYTFTVHLLLCASVLLTRNILPPKHGNVRQAHNS